MSARFLMLSTRDSEIIASSERRALLSFTGLSDEELVWMRLERDPRMRVDLDEWDGIILCGSRFDAGAPREEKSELQLQVEATLDDLYAQMVARDYPFIGLCYGLGTLCNFFGGVMDSTYTEEISAPVLTKTRAGEADPLLEGIPDVFRAYVGHHEGVRVLPPEMELLVRGAVAPVQMARVGKNMYATQFHPELDLEGIMLRIDFFANAGYYPVEERQSVEAGVQGIDTEPAHRILRNFATRFAGRRLS